MKPNKIIWAIFFIFALWLPAVILADFPYCYQFSQADSVELIIWNEDGSDTLAYADVSEVCTTFVDDDLEDADLWIFSLRILYEGATEWLRGFDIYQYQPNPVFDSFPYCMEFPTADSVRWIHYHDDEIDTVIQTSSTQMCTTLAVADMSTHYQDFFLLELLYDGAEYWVSGLDNFQRYPSPRFPEDAYTCTVWGYVYNIRRRPVSDASVTVSLGGQRNKDTCSNTILDGFAQSTSTDSTGYFSFELVRSSCIVGNKVYVFRATYPGARLSINRRTTVPDSISYRLTW